MSRHHRTSNFAKASREARPSIQASLPQPCVNRCTRGGIVHPDQLWDVAHIVDAHLGGTNERGNLGPAHRGCNRSDGGKIGAAMTNAARKLSTNGTKGRRPW